MLRNPGSREGKVVHVPRVAAGGDVLRRMQDASVAVRLQRQDDERRAFPLGH